MLFFFLQRSATIYIAQNCDTIVYSFRRRLTAKKTFANTKVIMYSFFLHKTLFGEIVLH